MIPEWAIAIITSLIGGGVVAGFIDYKARKEDRGLSASEKLREELWGDFVEQRNRIDRLDTELTSWKKQYFELLNENIQQKGTIRDLLRQIKVLQSLLLSSDIDVTPEMFIATDRIIREMETDNDE